MMFVRGFERIKNPVAQPGYDLYNPIPLTDRHPTKECGDIAARGHDLEGVNAVGGIGGMNPNTLQRPVRRMPHMVQALFYLGQLLGGQPGPFLQARRHGAEVQTGVFSRARQFTQPLMGENSSAGLGVPLQSNDNCHDQVSHRSLSEEKTVFELRRKFLLRCRQVFTSLDQNRYNREPGTIIQTVHGSRQILQNLPILFNQLQFVDELFPLLYQQSGLPFIG